MRVKRLEINGFKSFKDKTVIHFDHNVTGIVGPNGCGKSNIVDAFFWVMGEQSYKHMRGKGSDDLIFNGSSKYNPLGMAEATMVLETDFVDNEKEPMGASAKNLPVHLRAKEVSVTRRVYRGGEGEYLINGLPARLKDIQELFMDTGVGAKGYSVIEQGQIDKVVNAKPEERRLLIEEAAGIAKYKARKRESLRKMDGARLNLERLQDVISEIERSLRSLERQAQKARRYREYKDELFGKEMTWGRRKRLVLSRRLEQIKTEKEAMVQELAGMRSELHTKENNIESERTSQLTDTHLAEELQEKVNQLAGELAKEQSSLELVRRRREDLFQQSESLVEEQTNLTAAIEVEKKEFQARRLEVETFDATYESASEETRGAEARVSELRTKTTEIMRELDSLRLAVTEALHEQQALTHRKASLESKVEHQNDRIKAVVEQREEIGPKFEAAEQELEKKRSSLAGLDDRKSAAGEHRNELTDRMGGLREEIKIVEKERHESLQHEATMKSRLQSLEELVAAHEGYPDGAKALLDWVDENGLTDDFQAVADLVEVSDEDRVALESYLEGRLQAAVAKNPREAMKGLRELRSQEKGRAEILLEGSAASTADLASVSENLSAAGISVVGPLSDRVQSASPAIQTLISQAILVKSVEGLDEWVAGGGLVSLGSATLVTRDGFVLESSGVLRGGGDAVDPATSLLGRKKTIVELSERVVGAEKDFLAKDELLTRLRGDRETVEIQLEEARTELRTVELDHKGLERDLHQEEKALNSLRSQVDRLDEEEATARSLIVACQGELGGIGEQMSAAIEKKKMAEQRMPEVEAAAQTQSSDLQTAEGVLSDLRINEASLRERNQSFHRELSAAESVLNDREKRLSEVERLLTRIQDEQATHQDDSTQEALIVELIKELGTQKETLAEVKDRLEKTGAQLGSAMDRIKELHHHTDELSGKVSERSIESERISADLEHLIRNLEEKYGQNCLDMASSMNPVQEEMDDPVVTEEMSVEEEQILEEEVEALREKIRRLGEVNPNAVDEFEELKKRHDYLLSERLDLEESIANLKEAIDHINKTSEERFSKAFEAIASRFEKLFPIVFGGGRAQLSLVYPEGSTDILDAGVDILAQPPGKKVVNINVLSGGEKALTAVSMVFAIFMVKPSPFCLLDEVDAPLDDSNIGKFNTLLKEMAAKTQFIIITHNKKTMEMNDTLYGVTMEEPGVSKLVSIEIQ